LDGGRRHTRLALGAREGPLDDARLAWIFDLSPSLKKWQSPAGALCGWQKQMLTIARDRRAARTPAHR
jgi:branched-chain amino acid transport system ATP-binding protein